MMFLKRHRKAGQTAGSNESNTSHGSTRAKSRGVSRKKPLCEEKKQAKRIMSSQNYYQHLQHKLHLQCWIGEEHLQPADNWSEVAKHADTINSFEGLYGARVSQPISSRNNLSVYLSLKMLTSFIN